MSIQSIVLSLGHDAMIIIETIFIYTLVMIVMYFFYIRFWDGAVLSFKKIKRGARALWHS